MEQLNAGDILLGKYRVEEIIGVGGMGRVIKASHLYLQQPVAIKVLLPQMVDSQSTVARFLREAQATVRLRSEHIARVMDVGTMPDGTPFMVMEYLEGHDLNQILRHHGPQLAQAVVDLMLQACEGMAEAHAMGIIHRDIKPSNFFITRRPDGSNLLKILDFGISKTPAEISELTGTQTVIGTPTYMAPEQMVSARSTDPRSDLWSMGVVMYQLLAGRPPFEAETYAQLVLKVGTDAPAPLHVPLPGGLADIVFRCLEKKPENRIQSVGELARMLAPYASDPMSAQQAAERASRILTTPRGSQPGFPLSGSGGGLSMTPPVLTPKSWNATNGSSLSGGAGQIGTKVVRGGRGLVIAGVATLCVLAGVGGFIIASSMKNKDSTTAAHATEPNVQHMPTPGGDTKTEADKTATGTTPTGTTPTGTTPTGTTPTGTTPTGTTPNGTNVAAKSDATKTDASKTDATKTDATKTDASKTTKTDATKTAVKTDATKTDSTKTDASKTATKTDATKTATKTDATKTDATKTAVKTDATKTATKTDATKTATKSTSTKTATKTTKSTHTTKTKPKGDDLFDDRK
ncbi:MAG TPA: serine/threonine-protein kinase [Kofleriaceae bacterium]|nr:serine/threonine-protein kinase [Kofleriaceae bacterium]